MSGLDRRVPLARSAGLPGELCKLATECCITFPGSRPTAIPNLWSRLVHRAAVTRRSFTRVRLATPRSARSAVTRRDDSLRVVDHPPIVGLSGHFSTIDCLDSATIVAIDAPAIVFTSVHHQDFANRKADCRSPLRATFAREKRPPPFFSLFSFGR